MICMGRKVVLVMKNGREIEPPLRYGMLHDPSGVYWPKCSLLIAKFTQGKHLSDDSDGKNYFGRKSTFKEGFIDLPPRDLDRWTRVGEIDEIFYDRAGEKAPGFFQHRFHKPRGLWKPIFKVWGVFSKKITDPIVVYRLGRAYRIELPTCIIDDRGVAAP